MLFDSWTCMKQAMYVSIIHKFCSLGCKLHRFCDRKSYYCRFNFIWNWPNEQRLNCLIWQKSQLNYILLNENNKIKCLIKITTIWGKHKCLTEPSKMVSLPVQSRSFVRSTSNEFTAIHRPWFPGKIFSTRLNQMMTDVWCL